MLINGLKHHQSHRKNLKSDLIMQVTWPHTLAIWSPKFEIPLNAPIYSCLIRCNTINYRLLGFVLRCGIWPPARCNYYSLFNKQWKAKEAVDKGPSTRFGINRALNSPRFGPVWDLLHSKFGIPPPGFQHFRGKSGHNGVCPHPKFDCSFHSFPVPYTRE